MIGLLIAAYAAANLAKSEKKEALEVPKNFDNLYKKFGDEYDFDWKILKAIAMNESNEGAAPSVAEGLRNPANVEGSKSTDGKSWGLMQVTLTTAKSLDATATPQKLNNPEYSVMIAAKYLDWLLGQFPTVDARYMEWVIKSYNQGPGNTAKERSGSIKGYAQSYWDRYQRNYAKIEG